ncbi:MAG TPA: type II toxin-antitoxin system VapC family toxin [Candidatus Limnocylindrales bacterium]|nr:type II toxin-antitoxin system VapC family toxin [Candidatus Limnocylindrales bacterium]
MIAYFDTSAYVKLFLDEPDGHTSARAWVTSDAVSTARLTYVESRAAVAAARRAARLDAIRHDAIVRLLDDAWQELVVVDLDENRMKAAGDLAESYGLRAGDAVQLASALALGPEVVLVAFDARLRAAGRAAGLPVYPPEPVDPRDEA